MPAQLHRKTHPMVLTAAVAVTIFSILGSAAITGLIPSAHSHQEAATTATETNGDASSKQDQQGLSTKSAAPDHGMVKNASASPVDTERPPLKSHTSAVADKTPSCKSCGTIESIRTIESEGDGTGLGAVAGGVAGGVLGNQIGKGKGNTLMTILGIGGGAYAGHTIEKNIKSTTSYLVKVRMQDGSYRSVTQHSEPEFAVGDHVRVANGSITST